MKLLTQIKASFKFSISLCLLFLTTNALGIENNSEEFNWKIYRNENNIIGFERSLPDAKFIETKSEATLNYPIERLLDVLNNPNSYNQWMYRCTEAHLLEQNNDHSRVLYFVQSAPLGSSDRQVILQTNTHTETEGTIKTTVKSIAKEEQSLPPYINDDNRVWMVNYQGEWRLSSVDSDHTKVSYTAHTHPGGFSPAFIVNSEIRNVTFNTIQGMIRYLNKREFD
jgi:hypothetical protein